MIMSMSKGPIPMYMGLYLDSAMNSTTPRINYGLLIKLLCFYRQLVKILELQGAHKHTINSRAISENVKTCDKYCGDRQNSIAIACYKPPCDYRRDH